MSMGANELNGAWIEFGGYFFYFHADLKVTKREEGEFELKGEGSSLPDPLLFRKKITPPPLRQFPGSLVEYGPIAIGLNSKNGFSTIYYNFFDQSAGERLTLQAEVAGEVGRHGHKREYSVKPGALNVAIHHKRAEKKDIELKISYSPTLVDEKIEKLTKIRDSIQKEIEQDRV